MPLGEHRGHDTATYRAGVAGGWQGRRASPGLRVCKHQVTGLRKWDSTEMWPQRSSSSISWPRAKQLGASGHPAGPVSPHPPEASLAQLPAPPTPTPSCPWSEGHTALPPPTTVHRTLAHMVSPPPTPSSPAPQPELTPTAAPGPHSESPSHRQPPQASVTRLQPQGRVSSAPSGSRRDQDPAQWGRHRGGAVWQGRKEARSGQLAPPGSPGRGMLSPPVWHFLLPGHQAPTSPGRPHQPPSQPWTYSVQ